MYYPAETRLTPLTSIRRERLLPVAGEVLVAAGDEVQATDVVARCRLPVEAHVIDVSRELDVARDTATQHVNKVAGDTVQLDEIVAAAGELPDEGRAECRSPVAGHVLEIRNGLVLIEADATFQLLAGIRGRISSVVPERGVIVSTAGALIQGVWGSGPEVTGILRVPLDYPLNPLRSRHLDAAGEGTLLVAGRILDSTVFDSAAEIKVGGLLVGSVNAHLIPRLRSLPCSVMVIHGFGSFPISDPAFSLLQSEAGSEATLYAEVRSLEGAGRPELLIPKAEPAALSAHLPGPIPLGEGMQVRGLREPYLGLMGTVRSLPSHPHLVESGARLPVAEVELAPEERIALIPLANLEIVR